MCVKHDLPFDINLWPLMRKQRSHTHWRWQMIIENLRGQPLQIALGSTTTFWHFRKSSKSDKSPPAVQRAVLDRSIARLCLLSGVVVLYVVKRFSERITNFEKMKTTSQASPLISRCPVTAVFAFGTRPYPILHLCHSAPTDQQSNFTQVRSDWGDTETGMRIYASTKTRSFFEVARGLVVLGEEMGWRMR